MPSRTPYDAVRAFTRPLQQTLSCITRAALDIRGRYHPGPEHPLTLTNAEPVRLAGEVRLSLAVEMRYRITADAAAAASARWSVAVAMYIYTLYNPNGDVLLAYHWHPQGRSHITTPHFHLGPGSGANDLVAGAHLPSGVVTLADVVRMTIQELGVRPLRADWADVLDRADVVLRQ